MNQQKESDHCSGFEITADIFGVTAVFNVVSGERSEQMRDYDEQQLKQRIELLKSLDVEPDVSEQALKRVQQVKRSFGL